ncbi:glycosyltransferase [Campylobacter sp. W0066.2]|uniref:glycosyltransferase n=1 Tax=Campylobacter sp. W0066.2 TaxID=2735752 RepID=UPI002A586B19|nr:glycosyltransferase [Campylobacter sp. W0066.2]
MKKYNVVLLGGSNSVIVNGLQKGLRQENVNLINLALGATDSIQNLYELKRKRNQQIINKADLIITESNVNDSWVMDDRILFDNLKKYYQELSSLRFCKILVIILPFFSYNHEKVVLFIVIFRANLILTL